MTAPAAPEPGAPARATPGPRPSLFAAAAPLAVAALLVLLPAPAGLAPAAWRYFALFSGVVVGLILEPIPGAAIGVIGVAIATASKLVAPTPAAAIAWGLSGFGNTTVWLVFAAFIFALGYEKTGLGRRIALQLVRALGGRTVGLGYAVMLADLALAPFTPSNTARSAGTIFPIVSNIPPLYGSYPGPTARRIGAYVMWVGFAATAVTSSMFLTALAPNLLALQIVRNITHLDISLWEWFGGFWWVGAGLVAVVPYLVYRLYPPEIRESREIPAWAAGELAAMGRVSRRELIMAGLVLVAVGLWIGAKEAIEATTVALLAISAMLVTRIVSWDDIVGFKSAWSVWALLATLVTLADGLNRVGFIGWFAKGAATLMTGYPPTVVMLALVGVFFFVHYMFASITAHTTAVLPVVLAAGMTVPGVPVKTFALLLCYSLGLMGILTPYATGPAPVYFGSGYVTRREFWTLGLVFGLLFFGALALLGVTLR